MLLWGKTTCKNGLCHPGVILSWSVCWGFKVTGTFLWSAERGKELNQWFVAVYLAIGCGESRINVWPSSVLSGSITAVELTLWSACSVGRERAVVDSMRLVLHCDLLWQARSSAERVNGKMQESNPLLSWVVWKERRDWWKVSKGGRVCVNVLQPWLSSELNIKCLVSCRVDPICSSYMGYALRTFEIKCPGC